MPTEKRQRQKTGSRQRREEAVAERRRADRRRTIRNLVLLAIVVIGLAVVVSITAGDDKSDTSDVNTDEGTETTAPDPTAPDSGTGDEALGVDGEDGASPFKYGEGACPPADGAPEPVIDFESAPKSCIDPAKSHTAVFTTNKGVVEVKLDTERTPGTTNNFVALTRYRYYDGTSLFRAEKATGIIQGGSPHTQSNEDPGPGYPLHDEGGPFLQTPEGLVGPFQDYSPGTLAMARSDGPDAGSAQFFFVARDAQYLSEQGTYVVFGKVTSGLEVLEAIADLDDGSGKPNEPVTIESVIIREG